MFISIANFQNTTLNLYFSIKNPVFHLATVEGDQPRVRGMLLFRADEKGIIFHTASSKDVYSQLKQNPKAELCFNSPERQVRVTGELVEVIDEQLKEEIFNHPSRKFLQAWKENGVEGMLRIFRMEKGSAVEWTMATNFSPKDAIEL